MDPSERSPRGNQLTQLLDKMERMMQKNILPEITELRQNFDLKLQELDTHISSISGSNLTPVHILLLGSGMMAEAVVTYMLLKPENRVMIASNIEADAIKIANKKGIDRCMYSHINVEDKNALQALVKPADIVISYVPAFLHVHVAKACLAFGKNLVTASYIAPEMQALDAEVRAKGLIFLNELGLDPGIDHLTTMRTIHEAERRGDKIIEYQSWCGGLPSPECCDNPLGYKFTWSPIGALRALANSAKFIAGNKVTELAAADVQYTLTPIRLNQALQLEGYPNRDSLSYKDIYQLRDARKVLRGTLRYRGFCEIMCALKELGFLAETPALAESWPAALEKALEKVPGDGLPRRIRVACVDTIKHYAGLTAEEKSAKAARIISALKFFGFFDPASKLHNLVKLLECKLTLNKGETDLIAMQHIFRIERAGKLIQRKSSLIQIGDRGSTAMNVAVGTPTAIGAQLILDGKVAERGVLRPIYPDIYEPVLAELEKFHIRFTEIEEEL